MVVPNGDTPQAENRVTIKLDRERSLKLTLGDLRRFKQETGVDLLGLGEDGASKVGLDFVSVLLWLAMKPRTRT